MAIRLLDKSVSELIAAGEVVERPASVIKELVENSIDAGATKITVEIKNGGITYMRITDNGCGIENDEVPLAFVRHATSKVRTQEDLEHISSLGFRGEALASVAAVSRVKMMTATEAGTGTEYGIEGGVETLYNECGCPKGTVLEISDLFYNTPARMKFLKSDVGEGNSVASVMDRLALSHPEIAFTFIRDGKTALTTPGLGDLFKTIYAVYGRDFANDLIPMDYEVGAVKATGYISKPQASRKSRLMQHFFVNGRYVKSDLMTAAVAQAYKNSIMAGRFASCVINVTLPPDMVDINVHPAKTECKFIEQKKVFDAIHYGIKTALFDGYTREEIKLDDTPSPTFKAEQGKQIGLHNTLNNTSSERIVKQFLDSLPKHQTPQTPEVEPVSAVLNDSNSADKNYNKPDNSKDILDIIVDDEEETPVESTAKNVEISLTSDIGESETAPQEVDIKLIGEVFDTYALVQAGEEMIIIDKHAAHERMIYEQLRDKRDDQTQMLLAPVPVTLSKDEYIAVTENIDKLSELGFDVEDFGNSSVIVRGVPVVLIGCSPADVITEAAAGFASHRNDPDIAQLDWLYENMACRAAIKGGDRSGEDLMVIARRVVESADIRYCPHGRPVAYRLTRKELDKQFGRLG